MITKILNRDFKHPEDGWYEIERAGYYPAVAEDGRKILQVIDGKALASITTTFNRQAAAGQLPHGTEMLIDREHFRHHRDLKGEKDQESRAFGWAKELRVAPAGDAVQMRNKWTGTGKPAVDEGDYRFFSTEYDETTPGDVWQAVDASELPVEMRNKYPGYQPLRPMRLTGLTLTNDNNNKGQRPITVVNRQQPGAGHSSPAAGRAENFPGPGGPGGSEQQTKKERKTMKSVCTALGLSPDAAEDVVLAEVTKLKNRGEITPTDLTTLKNRSTDLETENKTLMGEQCEALLDAHGVKDAKVRDRLKPVLTSLKNRADRVATLTDFGFKLVEAPKPGTAQVKLHNRETNPPTVKSTAENAETELKGPDAGTATKIHNRAVAIRKDTPGLSLATAYRMAQNELSTAEGA